MEITTERLIMREFDQGDWPEVLEYQSDSLYLRYTHWTGRTPQAVREFVRIFLAQQEEQPRTKFQLAVLLKTSRQLIGNCGIRMKTVDTREGDIGFELSPKFWGHGYATEAARAIVDFGFSQLGLHRIWSWCIAENLGSAHLLRKLGMQEEGRLRENEYFKDRCWDTLLFGLLRREWKAV